MAQKSRRSGGNFMDSFNVAMIWRGCFQSPYCTSKYGILPKCNQKIIEYRRVGMLQTIVKSVDVIMFSGSRIHFQMRKLSVLLKN